MSVCEDDLICDLAETYHILHYRELSPDLVATLCFGLRDDSRVKMRVSGAKITLEQSLLARMADDLSFQSWAKTKDGQKGRNRPPSILKTLLEDKKEEENEIFLTSEDFDKAWEKITNGRRDNNR
jgi:hypothetical protein